MNKERPSYYAIIPSWVRYDYRLKDKSKLLYGEIVALSTKEGRCWASNDYFAKLYNTTTGTISKLISELVDCGYITRTIIYKEGTKEISARYLQIEPYLWSKLTIPMVENDKDNNTSINNININIKENIKRKETKFIPPTLEEIKNYISEKGLKVDAKQFYDYFEEGKWIDSKGNKVRNWKQKLLTWNKFNQGTKKEKQEYDTIEGDLNFLLEN